MNLEIGIAGASLIVSVGAIMLALSADARAKVAARAQLFLTLRTRFLDVLEDLPANYMAPDWDASNPEQRAAAIRYWHHAFDEWYVTERLDKKLMHQLWAQYYREATRAGLKHNGLRRALVAMRDTDEELAKLWSDYLEEVNSLWSEGHPRNATRCSGIGCQHEPA
jgi:hypothetical protein